MFDSDLPELQIVTAGKSTYFIEESVAYFTADDKWIVLIQSISFYRKYLNLSLLICYCKFYLEFQKTWTITFIFSQLVNFHAYIGGRTT